MIKFKCDYCGKKMGVPEKYAGKRVKCPGCEAPLQVPEPAGGAGTDALAALSGGAVGGLRSVEPAASSDGARAAASASPSSATASEGGGPKTCPNCGATCNPTAKICVDCGHGFSGLSAKNRVRAAKTANAAGRTGLAIVGGLATALVCGVVWAGVVKFTGYELGFLAWLQGIAAGVVVAVIARRGGVLVGFAAVLVSFLGWLAAKALIAIWVIQPMFAEFEDEFNDPGFARDSYVVERVKAEGDIDEDLYWSWIMEEYDNPSDEQRVQGLIDGWVAANGEPPAFPMLREGIVIDELMERGEIDAELYDLWYEDALNAEQYAHLDGLVAAHVAAHGEPDIESVEEVAGAVFGGLVLVISFIGALSLWDLLWVPLMAVSAFKTAASAEVSEA